MVPPKVVLHLAKVRLLPQNPPNSGADSPEVNSVTMDSGTGGSSKYFVVTYYYKTIIDNELLSYRKRKKELPKENVSTRLEPTVKNKAIVKLKAKDSDDEDYMAWKKPDINTPIVTFTPPPDDATPSSSFRYKSNILTKKHLESFNVRQNQHRAIFADGDDGFESLNGYNSNGSDGDNRVKILQARLSGNKIVSNERNEVTAKDDSANDVDKTPIDKVEENSTTTAKANVLKTEDDEKSNEPDSDVNVTDSPNRGKRIGVRFRSSWIPENVRNESSDDDFANVKNKQKVNCV